MRLATANQSKLRHGTHKLKDLKSPRARPTRSEKRNKYSELRLNLSHSMFRNLKQLSTAGQGHGELRTGETSSIGSLSDSQRKNLEDVPESPPRIIVWESLYVGCKAGSSPWVI